MLAAYLGCTPAGHIAACLKDGSTPPGVDPGDWVAWRERFDTHLQRYGHMIYDLDFSNPVPADDPVPLLETFQIFIRGQGANPCSRQEAAVQKREQAVQLVNNRVKGWRLSTFQKYLFRAQKYAPLREDGLADVGLGYPLLRRILGELGCRYVDGGLGQYPCDIYWLTKDELLQAAARLDGGTALGSLQAEVIERKAAWRAASRVTPPMMLPQMKLLGMDLSELKTRRARKLKGNIIKGVATSPGTVTGPACVLKSVEDFSKLKPGDILVAAITTPAWTPLFARAAGLVTDIGGPLSHGSIVAREYGIPAVLGTAVATQRIRNGQMITVNGANGTVQIS
jgi:pyruvate,water dikinase